MLKMSKYTNWSKEALISKILSLENSRNGHSTPSSAGLETSSSAAESKQSPERPQVIAPEGQPAKKKKKEMDFTKFAKRRVAIRFAYLGWEYHGLAYQKEGHRTVEGEILHAFFKTKCIASMDPAHSNFSRCGRTDAGVSAMAQVISLDLRSVVPAEQHNDAEMDLKELDYLKILNSHLPADILAYQICLRPPEDFDARFSCLSRHYHYYFDGSLLDIEAMQDAADRLIGEHDFRNFCKIDGSKQITNYNRRIIEARICRQEGDAGLHYLSLRGTAFLWNQVRSIMAILFLVGQKQELPSVVDKLLDVEAMPRRPAYEIAWGVPLVLYNCEFPALEWKSSDYTSMEPVHNVWHSLFQKQAITRTMMGTVMPFTGKLKPEDLISRTNIGQGIGHRSGRYVKLLERPVSDSPELVNKKWLERKKQKKHDNAKAAETD